MIEATHPDGERHRPKHAGQRSTCYACGGDVIGVRLPNSKTCVWQHKETLVCMGPDDGWRQRIRDGFIAHGFTPADAGDYVIGPGGPVAFVDGPEPVSAEFTDAFELAMKNDHCWLTWIVDGRYASLATDMNYPGHDYPRWLAGTEWSAFVHAWMRGRDGVTVAIELGYCLPRRDDPLFFIVRRPWPHVLKRVGGDLAYLPITGAHGYLVTFAQLVDLARTGRGPHTIDTHPLDTYRFSSQNIQRVYR